MQLYPTVSRIIFALCVALAGCAAPLEDPERFTGGSVGGPDAAPAPQDCADDIETEVLAVQCTGVVCHSAANPAAELDLESPNLAARVVGVASSTCDGHVLVDPDDVDASFLLNKLTAQPACGDRMPLGGALPDDVQACIRAWAEGL